MSFGCEAPHAAAVFEKEHRLPRQHHQHLRLLEGDAMAGRIIEDAHCAEGQSCRCYDQRASVEVDIRLLSDERIIGKAGIRPKIRHDENTGFADGVAANRELDWDFAAKSEICFAPLAI